MTDTVHTPCRARKPALTEAGIHPLIQERWSPRSFTDCPVEPAAIHSLLEAARWTGSSMNEQPWAFVVVEREKDPESHAAVVATLMAQNAVWAAKAPLLMVAAAKLAFTRNGALNRWAFYDVGGAVTQMVLQGEALGLGAHQMAGFDVEQARAALGIPEGYDPLVVVAFGYPGPAEALEGELRTRELAPRSRKPAADWTYQGKWGQPYFPAP